MTTNADLTTMTESLDTMTLAEYLDQGEVWMAKNGAFPVAGMDTVYARRCLHFLTRNCAEIFRLYTMEAFVDADTAPTLDTMVGWLSTRPSMWIRSTVLFRALLERVPAELV